MNFSSLLTVSSLLDSDAYNSQYKKLVEMLEESLRSKRHNEDILWITYRILDEESRRKILEFRSFLTLGS